MQLLKIGYKYHTHISCDNILIKIIHAKMRLLLSLSLIISELTDATYDKFQNNVIMFFDNSAEGRAGYDAVIQASEQIPTNVYVLNCSKYPSACSNMPYDLPAFRVPYKEYSFTMSREEATDPERLFTFVERMTKSMFDRPISAMAYSEQVDARSWFEVYGPDESHMEDLCILMKGHVKAAYFEAPMQKIIAHRQGIAVRYAGEWDQDSVGEFLETNNRPIFERLKQEDTLVTPSSLLCIYFFNPGDSD